MDFSPIIAVNSKLIRFKACGALVATWRAASRLSNLGVPCLSNLAVLRLSNLAALRLSNLATSPSINLAVSRLSNLAALRLKSILRCLTTVALQNQYPAAS